MQTKYYMTAQKEARSCLPFCLGKLCIKVFTPSTQVCGDSGCLI